ncbi:MAG: AAA family ATPase [Bacteroidota bacterium]|jgi:NadR type nicotinamide-nucleotide adenylyltransferase
MEKSVKKIAVIGAESTGKTTLCQKLAQHFNTTWVPEYARTYFESKSINSCQLSDIELIAKQQLHNESILVKEANQFLFCDTNLITLKIWAELEFNQQIEFIEQILPKCNFDLVLVINNSIQWQKDSLRENKFSRDLIRQLNINYLKVLQWDYAEVDPENLEKTIELILSI